MFENLSEKLGQVFDNLRGKGSLSEDDVDLALREIRVALLEADVALSVAKDFMARVRERAVGQAVIKSVSPTQQIVKIVHDAMQEMLGSGEEAAINLEATPPAVILMVGLQGAGKTTTTGKLGAYLKKERKKVMMASLDTQRPAAQDQLRILGEQTGVATLPIVAGQDVLNITKRALDVAKLESYDVLILDTAGRLAIDDELMSEVAQVRDIAQPVETLLVVDAMTGQDAVNLAHEFTTRIGITGSVLTRIDGDARGGAAMSMRAITGKPIKFMGTGEKLEALEAFKPDRIAGRILGMGDVVSLVEKAVESMDREQAEKAAKKFQDGKFDLDDFRAQISQMKKMGGAGAMMKMLPGLSRFSEQIDQANIDGGVLNRQEAIMDSMTKKERARPEIISNSASRRRRIAIGSGTSVQEVNRLLKQFSKMQGMMKKFRKLGAGGIMGMAKGLMGGNAFDSMMADATAQDPEALDKLNAAMPAQNGAGMGDLGGLGGMLPPNLSGLGGAPGLPGGLPKSFFTKKQTKKR